MSARQWVGRGALVLAVAAAAWSAATAISGGFALDAALRISSRDPLRPLLAAAVLFSAARFLLGGVEFRRGLARIAGADRGQMPARIACSAAVGLLVFSLAWNTRAAGGSD